MSTRSHDAALSNSASLVSAKRALWCLPFVLVPLVIWGNPLIAILCGAAVSLTVNRPIVLESGTYAKFALQSAIVLLGFNLDARLMWEVSQSYALPIALYVVLTLAAGVALGKFLGADRIVSRLIAAGTAICGGTAIASLSPVLKARGEQVAVALTIVFCLNMVAIVVFPQVGQWLGMTQTEFGIWSALAVHDTSSVVAVATIYGQQAAEVATTLKLGRTLWLIPVLLFFSLGGESERAKIRVPGFILLFIAASICGTAVHNMLEMPEMLSDSVRMASSALIVLALFFFGLECTRTTLRNLRGRTVILAAALWLAVIPLTLIAALNLA